MGAYLHLRDFDITESNSNANPGTRNNSGVDGPSCPEQRVEFGGLSTLSRIGIEEATSSAAHERKRNDDECADFWAGKLDDVFEDPHSRTTPVAFRGVRFEMTASQGRENSWSSSGGVRGLDCTDLPDERSIWGKSANWVSECCREAVTPMERMRHEIAAVEGASSSRSGGFGADCDIPREVSGRSADELEAVHHARNSFCKTQVDESEKLPDHLLIELLVRVPTRDWPAAACVKKRWAQLFKGDGLWQCALVKKWPDAASVKRWPGPIARGSNKRSWLNRFIWNRLLQRKSEDHHACQLYQMGTELSPRPNSDDDDSALWLIIKRKD